MLDTPLRNILEERAATGAVMKSYHWASDNREGLVTNGQTEKMLNADLDKLLMKFLYLQVSIQSVEGCKISPAGGRLNVAGGRTEPVQDHGEARLSARLENSPFLIKQDSISRSRQIFGSNMPANE